MYFILPRIFKLTVFHKSYILCKHKTQNKQTKDHQSIALTHICTHLIIPSPFHNYLFGFWILRQKKTGLTF